MHEHGRIINDHLDRKTDVYARYETASSAPDIYIYIITVASFVYVYISVAIVGVRNVT